MTDRILGNRYELESEIGRGGMGVVYKSTDTEVKRTVAVKTLPAVMSHNHNLMRRFTSEVQHASKLEHPNIVRVYDVGEDDGTHFYVMQYIDGSDLRSQMKSKGRYSVDDAISIISQVADALDYAHSQGIVHRDIKPENVLLDSEGNPHVADFGIAKATEGTRTTRGMLGTPEYMSPEQVKGKSADARSDQYSLAVVAYEMLTGRTPFKTEGDDPWAQINMHLNTPVPNPKTTVPDIPTHVANALLQALAKKPEQRFGSCSDLVKALRGEVVASVSSQRRQRIAVLGTAAAVCLILIAAGFALRFRSSEGGNARHKSQQPQMVDQIAFVSTVDAISRLVALGPGSKKTNISAPFKSGEYPLWDIGLRHSCDGRTLLVGVGGAYQDVCFKAIYLIRPDGRQSKLATGNKLEIGGVSSDGSVAVFSDGNIRVIDTATLKVRTLTRSGKANNPSLSSDAANIMYVDCGRVYTVGIDGSRRRVLTCVPGAYTFPVASPRDNCVAYLDDSQLTLMDSSGRTRVLLPRKRATTTDDYGSPVTETVKIGLPVFSRDGRSLAVSQDSTLCLFDVASGSQTSIDMYDEGIMGGFQDVVFGPRGDKVFFCAQVGGEGAYDGVLEMDLKSRKLKTIAFGTHPCWIKIPKNSLIETSKKKHVVVMPEEVIGKATQVS